MTRRSSVLRAPAGDWSLAWRSDNENPRDRRFSRTPHCARSNARPSALSHPAAAWPATPLTTATGCSACSSNVGPCLSSPTIRHARGRIPSTRTPIATIEALDESVPPGLPGTKQAVWSAKCGVDLAGKIYSSSCRIVRLARRRRSLSSRASAETSLIATSGSRSRNDANAVVLRLNAAIGSSAVTVAERGP